jgi:hypothetical protein
MRPWFLCVPLCKLERGFLCDFAAILFTCHAYNVPRMADRKELVFSFSSLRTRLGAADVIVCGGRWSGSKAFEWKFTFRNKSFKSLYRGDQFRTSCLVSLNRMQNI